MLCLVCWVAALWGRLCWGLLEVPSVELYNSFLLSINTNFFTGNAWTGKVGIAWHLVLSDPNKGSGPILADSNLRWEPTARECALVMMLLFWKKPGSGVLLDDEARGGVNIWSYLNAFTTWRSIAHPNWVADFRFLLYFSACKTWQVVVHPRIAVEILGWGAPQHSHRYQNLGAVKSGRGATSELKQNWLLFGVFGWLNSYKFMEIQSATFQGNGSFLT